MATADTSAAAATDSGQDDGTRTFALPSGRVATMREPKGRDLRQAGRVVPPGASQTDATLAMVAQVTLLDGQAIVSEDLDDLSMADVNQLVATLMEISGGNFPAG